MSRRSSISSTESDNSMEIIHTCALRDFSDAPELKPYANYSFYQCWGGGPVGGFIRDYPKNKWYKINKNGFSDPWTIEELSSVNVFVTPHSITVTEMPYTRVSKFELFCNLNYMIENEDERVCEELDLPIHPVMEKWLNEYIEEYNHYNSRKLNLTVFKDSYLIEEEPLRRKGVTFGGILKEWVNIPYENTTDLLLNSESMKDSEGNYDELCNCDYDPKLKLYIENI